MSRYRPAGVPVRRCCRIHAALLRRAGALHAVHPYHGASMCYTVRVDTSDKEDRMASRMRAGRPHKAFVIVTDEAWREFRALCLTRGETVQDYLGYLVAKEVKTAKTANTRRAVQQAKKGKAVDAAIRAAGGPAK